MNDDSITCICNRILYTEANKEKWTTDVGNSVDEHHNYYVEKRVRTMSTHRMTHVCDLYQQAELVFGNRRGNSGYLWGRDERGTMASTLI